MTGETHHKPWEKKRRELGWILLRETMWSRFICGEGQEAAGARSMRRDCNIPDIYVYISGIRMRTGVGCIQARQVGRNDEEQQQQLASTDKESRREGSNRLELTLVAMEPVGFSAYLAGSDWQTITATRTTACDCGRDGGCSMGLELPR